MAEPSSDPNIAIAVLFERLGNVITKLDELSQKMDNQSVDRDRVLNELEERIVEVEKTLSRARGFMAGIAAGGGAIGGAVASIVANALGGGI